jgi:kinesin family protein 18/19
MIANVSPSSSCYEDTKNTLKYANRAKNIKVKLSKNYQNVDNSLSQYGNIISQLTEEIRILKSELNKSNNLIPPLLVSNIRNNTFGELNNINKTCFLSQKYSDEFVEAMQTATIKEYTQKINKIFDEKMEIVHETNLLDQNLVRNFSSIL